MLFFMDFLDYSASFTEIEKVFYNVFSNVPFPLSLKMFPSSLFTSTMSPCSLEPLNDPQESAPTVFEALCLYQLRGKKGSTERGGKFTL